MRAVADWPAHGVPREPLAWLTRVARNTLISHFRRMQPELVDPAVLDAIVRDDGTGGAAAGPSGRGVGDQLGAGTAAGAATPPCSRSSTSPIAACATSRATAGSRSARSKAGCGALGRSSRR